MMMISANKTSVREPCLHFILNFYSLRFFVDVKHTVITRKMGAIIIFFK